MESGQPGNHALHTGTRRTIAVHCNNHALHTGTRRTIAVHCNNHALHTGTRRTTAVYIVTIMHYILEQEEQ